MAEPPAWVSTKQPGPTRSQATSPPFQYSSQTLLTRSPYQTSAQSALMILRPATNLSIGTLQVERQGPGGSYTPLKPGTPLKGGDRLRVSAPVTYEADPTGGPVTVPIWAGISGGRRAS